MSTTACHSLAPQIPETGLTVVLRFVNARLDAAALVTAAEAREAMALAIFEEVTRFVLNWQEGTVASTTDTSLAA